MSVVSSILRDAAQKVIFQTFLHVPIHLQHQQHLQLCSLTPYRQIQVAHFVPDSISISGEGVFPRISMDLPRHGDEEGLYDTLMKEARETLERDTQKKALQMTVSGTPAGSPLPRDQSHEDAKSMVSLQVRLETLKDIPQSIVILKTTVCNRSKILNPSPPAVHSWSGRWVP